MNSIRLGFGLTLILTLGVGLSGCVLDDLMGDPYGAGGGAAPGYGYDSNIDVKGASLVGDMGSVREIAGPATYTESWGDGYWASINVHSEGTRGFAMGIVNFEGGLDHADLVPGATLHFSNIDYYDGTYDPSALNVSVTGCSGPSDGDWQFDEPADAVDVKVTEGADPGYLHFEIDAHWNSQAQDVTAQFDAQQTPTDSAATDPYGPTPGI